MSYSRRLFLKTFSQLLALITYWRPNPGFTQIQSANPFSQQDFASLFSQYFGQRLLQDTDQIQLTLPDIAENGAEVPFSIASSLTNIQQLTIWVEKNPSPLIAELDLSAGIPVFFAGRLKMATSCDVLVIIETAGQLYKTKRWVNVMQGGCGTG